MYSICNMYSDCDSIFIFIMYFCFLSVRFIFFILFVFKLGDENNEDDIWLVKMIFI